MASLNTNHVSNKQNASRKCTVTFKRHVRTISVYVYDKQSAKFDAYTDVATYTARMCIYVHFTLPVMIIMTNQTYDSHKSL